MSKPIDPPEIFLSAACCADSAGRLWCQHDAFEHAPGCKTPDAPDSVRYIRADLVPEWRPIEEMREHHGPCAVMHIADAGYLEVVHVLDIDFDPATWTHFALVPRMTNEDGERLLEEWKARKETT